LVVFAIVIFQSEREEKTEQPIPAKQLTMNISGKQISEKEIEVTIKIPVSGYTVSTSESFDYGYPKIKCYFRKPGTYGDDDIGVWCSHPTSSSSYKCDNCPPGSTSCNYCYSEEYPWKEWTYTYKQYTKMSFASAVFTFSEGSAKAWNATFKIPNFVQQGKDSYILTGSPSFSTFGKEWTYKKKVNAICEPNYRHCGKGNWHWSDPIYSGEKPPIDKPSFTEILITKANIDGDQTVAPNIYDNKVQDLKLTFRTDIDGLSDLYRYSFGEYEFYAHISTTKKNYHEITLPSENAKYKIKAYNTAHYTEQGDVDYATYKEFEVTIPEIPQINIEITRHSIVGNRLEVRFRIENETDKTEKHFYYREIGHGINDPKVNKLGNEYGVELTLKNGNYEYWIFAKDGDQEKTTDRVSFSINVTEEGLKFTKRNEEIKQTSYGLEFELSEKINDVYYIYKKKDEPVSALKEGSIPRFGNEYNFLISNLTPDTLYELDVFAENEKVYSTEFRTLFTQEILPPTTTPPEEDEGFTISSFFILIAIIGVLLYYFYTQIKKGGKKK